MKLFSRFLIAFFVLNMCLIFFLILEINYVEASSGSSGEVVHLQSPINIQSPVELVAAIVRFTTVAIGLIAVAAMIYAGILYFTSGGNEEQAGKAKKTITYAIVGLIVVILSYVIINTLINAIGG
ncbi:MAG: hypothetical protein WC220_14665 [Pedobacter sp.]|jgi:hypothetical protein